MKILSIESASLTASCAISDNEKMLGEYTLNHKKTHSEKLMPLIQELMKELNLKITDIDVIAISEGPGSYTGLRIGAAIAKGLSFGTNIKIANIPTLKSLASNIYDEDKLIVPVMDARAERIYTGIYKWENGRINTVKGQFPCTVQELTEILNDFKEPLIFNGDGSVNYKQKIQKNLNKIISFAPEKFNCLYASSLCLIAYDMALKGELISGADLKPNYLRMSQAERCKK